MPIGTVDISMDGIAAELALGTSFGNNSMFNVLYGISQNSFAQSAGSYHNLAMALPGLTDTFATAIEAKYSANQNMGLKNWAGYNHDENVKLNMQITNNSADDVQCDLEIAANPGAVGSGVVFYSGMVPAGNNVAIAVLDTGVPGYSTYGVAQAEYVINATFRDVTLTPTRCFMTVPSAIDDDGVGPDLTRGPYTGTWDLIVQGMWNDNIVVGANGWGAGPPFISWNKRTRFAVEFNP